MKKYLIPIIILFLLFRIPGLGIDVSNTDALRWHRRSEKFLTALKTGNLIETYQHYQPGITLMWINTPVKQLSFTIQNKLLKVEQPKTLENADYYPTIHGISKTVLVLVLCGLLLAQIFIIKHLFNEKVALVFGFLMAIEPYMIGMDRWFHLTSLETYFAFLSFLTILWWNKERNSKLLILSGAFLALSALSKITTLLVVPLFLTIIVLNSWEEKKYTQIFRSILIFGFSFFGVFVILFPALVIDPIFVFNEIFSAGKNAVISSRQLSHLEILFKYSFYLLMGLFKLSPLVIFAFIFSFSKKKEIYKDRNLKLTLIYTFFYLVFLTIAYKKIDRYIVVMFPPIILLVSYYLSLLSTKNMGNVLITGLLFTVVTSFVYYPVYSAYNSPLLGGARTAIKLGLYDNSGEYLSDAALYLNNMGRDKKVFVPNGSISALNIQFPSKKLSFPVTIASILFHSQ